MITKQARIMTMVSCAKMHDHGAISVLWTFENDDPFALTIHPEDTDQHWQVDRLKFSDVLASCVPGLPLECGVASLQLRASNPYALSLRLTDYTHEGEKHVYLICATLELAKFLDKVNGRAPTSFDACVDATLDKIFS